MRMRYDIEVDALAVEFRPGATSARTVAVAPGVNVDFDAKGRLVTLELLDASRHVPRQALERLPSAKDYLTLAEAARESGLAAATLRVQINKGRIAAVKRGRDWLVDATALLNYLESRDQRGRPPAAPRARRARAAQRAAARDGEGARRRLTRSGRR